MEEAYTRHWESGRRRGKKAEKPRTAADAARSSYYGVPVIHRVHWGWHVVVYFFLGGIAGASYLIAAISALVGPREDRTLVRAGRFLSLLALLPCPLLLILDLGRPERFLHMLRVVKLRSPMSIGIWTVIVFSAFSGFAAVYQAAIDGILGRNALARLICRLPARAIGGAGIVPAFLMSGYTGPLLGATAVPLWAKNALLLGPLFLASALSTSASTIALLLNRTRGSATTMQRVETVERIAMAAELGLLASSRLRLGETAKPLEEGKPGAAMRYGVIGAGLVAPMAIQAVNRRHRRTLVTAASLLTIAGGLALRYAVIAGGHASADDPQATFEFTQKR
ncbi:MAG TPA: NrfD/PsrC family molybdoenzyme membrane anchor subunit [Thermomicrobiales bacterium]|nr:NrfD/PsrC family molybdoenzyme membrane anchor subunit [Thermomicrobiales bacterium]